MKRKNEKTAAAEGPAPQGSYVSGGTHSEQRMGKLDTVFLARWNGGRSIFFCILYLSYMHRWIYVLFDITMLWDIMNTCGILWDMTLGLDEMVSPSKFVCLVKYCADGNATVSIISSGLQSTVMLMKDSMIFFVKKMVKSLQLCWTYAIHRFNH